MKKDTVYLTMLLDYYGDLLTDKQREYFDLHYNQDYTLSEIGEMNGISRQGVWEIVRRAEAAMRLEPGVLMIYAIAEKDAPHKVTIVEIYADRAAYESHLKTAHFLKYKHGTLDMVEDLQLIDVKPLF